jgi:6-phosphogluconolactonase (cycloisomerase 2 family)
LVSNVSTGMSSSSLTLAPSGKFAYITNLDSNTVLQFAIDSNTGALFNSDGTYVRR